jgi:hypothetical protein
MCYNTIVPRERRHELGTVEVEPICSCEYQKSRLDDFLEINCELRTFFNTKKRKKVTLRRC